MNQLIILIINRNIVYLLLFFIPFTSAHSKKCVTELSDSIKSIIKYDIEGIKYAEIQKSGSVTMKVCYYTREGKSIDKFNWKINVKIINNIRDRILSQFFIDDYTYSSGKAIILLIADPWSKSVELRLIKGLVPSFNKELIRVLKRVENNIVFTREDIPIIVPFSVDLASQRKDSP